MISETKRLTAVDVPSTSVFILHGMRLRLLCDLGADVLQNVKVVSIHTVSIDVTRSA